MGNGQSSKHAYVAAIMNKLAGASGEEVNSDLMKRIGASFTRFNVADLNDFNVVLSTIFTKFEDRISAAAGNGVPDRVPEDFHPHLIERLEHSNQTGEVENQMDTLAGLGVVMGDSWRHGRIGVVKNQVAAVERICENVKRVIKAQLYSNLK